MTATSRLTPEVLDEMHVVKHILVAFQVWRVHRSVAHSVDQLLNDMQPVVELRQLAGDEIHVELEQMEQPEEEQPETWIKASKRLKLYAYELPRHELQDTIQEIGVSALVEVTMDPLKADAIVALRSRYVHPRCRVARAAIVKLWKSSLRKFPVWSGRPRAPTSAN